MRLVEVWGGPFLHLGQKDFLMIYTIVPVGKGWSDVENVAEEKLRTRWRRWLGNKTKQGYPYWVTLLDSEWAHWAASVLDDERLSWKDATRENVKAYWLRAINKATMRELYRLDDVYAIERMGKNCRK